MKPYRITVLIHRGGCTTTTAKTLGSRIKTGTVNLPVTILEIRINVDKFKIRVSTKSWDQNPGQIQKRTSPKRFRLQFHIGFSNETTNVALTP